VSLIFIFYPRMLLGFPHPNHGVDTLRASRSLPKAALRRTRNQCRINDLPERDRLFSVNYQRYVLDNDEETITKKGRKFRSRIGRTSSCDLQTNYSKRIIWTTQAASCFALYYHLANSHCIWTSDVTTSQITESLSSVSLDSRDEIKL